MKAILVEQVANSNSHMKSGKIEPAWQSGSYKCERELICSAVELGYEDGRLIFAE